MEELLNSSFDKKRWAIDEESNTIRATHGHSIAIEQVLEPAVPLEMLYDGTALSNIVSIFKTGLSRMECEQVHLSAKPADALTVGARHGKPVLIEVSTAELVASGALFYSTENDIWLTGDIPGEYLALTPWYSIAGSQEIQDAMLAELKKEVRIGDKDLTPDVLTSLKAIWRDQQNDDVLFESSGGEVFQIHLTWKGSAEASGWPSRKKYASFEEWLRKEVVQGQKDFFLM